MRRWSIRGRPLVAAALTGAAGLVLGLAVGAAVGRRSVTPTRTTGREAPPPAAPGWLRRFVTRWFNPLVVRLGLVGGRRSPWGFLEHTGRTTGAVYRTPVLPRLAGDHAWIALPYGVDVNWARNVRAAGHCRLQVHDLVYELDEPATVTAAEHEALPERVRPWLVARGNRYLRMRVLSEAPGRLTTVPATEPVLIGPATREPSASGSPGVP